VSQFEFKIVDHTMKPDEKVVEVWFMGRVVAALYAHTLDTGEPVINVTSSLFSGAIVDPRPPVSVLIGLTTRDGLNGRSQH
jgi:hypothetical protein